MTKNIMELGKKEKKKKEKKKEKEKEKWHDAIEDGSGAKVWPARGEERANLIAKPSFYHVGRIVEQVARIYGYSLLIAGICSFVMSGFSSLPWTKWDDKEGVPRAKVAMVSLLLELWIALGVSRSDSRPGESTRVLNRNSLATLGPAQP